MKTPSHEAADFYREQYEAYYQVYGNHELYASGRGAYVDNSNINNIAEDIERKLQLKKNDVLLDLGCGSGLFSLKFNHKVKKIECFDGSENAIRILQSKLPTHSNIACKTGDIMSPLPYSDDQFDKVLCYSVFHYLGNLENIKTVIHELLRITRPGGLILIGDLPMKVPFYPRYWYLKFIKQIILLFLIGRFKLSIRAAENYFLYLYQGLSQEPPSLARKLKIVLLLPFLDFIFPPLRKRLFKNIDLDANKNLKKKFVEKIGTYNKFDFLFFNDLIPEIQKMNGLSCSIQYQPASLPYSFERVDIMVQKNQ